jgi:hypothetical protein
MRELGSYERSDLTFYGVAVSGDYAYVGCGWSGLAVINIANASNPTLEQVIPSDGFPMGVTVSEGYLYVGENGPGFSIWDIRQTPAAPQRLVFKAGVPAMDIDVVGSLAYLAQGGALQIVDVSNKSAPTLLGSYGVTISTAVHQVKVQNNVAYVAGSEGGLITMDVSNSNNPTWLGRAPTYGQTLGVAVSGTWVFSALYNYGFAVIDVSNPAAPRIVKYVLTPGITRKVIVDDHFVYVTDDFGGLDSFSY